MEFLCTLVDQIHTHTHTHTRKTSPTNHHPTSHAISGAITSPQNKDGDTPLHIAIRQGQSEVVMLFKHNPVPEKLQLRNNDGLTAMDMVAANNMMELCRALTEDLCDNAMYAPALDTYYQDNSLVSAREHVSAVLCLYALIAFVSYPSQARMCNPPSAAHRQAMKNGHVRMITFIHSVQRKLAEKVLNMHGLDLDDTEETDLRTIQAILNDLPELIDE